MFRYFFTLVLFSLFLDVFTLCTLYIYCWVIKNTITVAELCPHTWIKINLLFYQWSFVPFYIKTCLLCEEQYLFECCSMKEFKNFPFLSFGWNSDGHAVNISCQCKTGSVESLHNHCIWCTVLIRVGVVGSFEWFNGNHIYIYIYAQKIKGRLLNQITVSSQLSRRGCC